MDANVNNTRPTRTTDQKAEETVVKKSKKSEDENTLESKENKVTVSSVGRRVRQIRS